MLSSLRRLAVLAVAGPMAIGLAALPPSDASAAVRLSTSPGLATPARGYLPPANPPANIAPIPDYTFKQGALYSDNDLPVCWLTFSRSRPNNPSCLAAEVAATDRAHRIEGLPAIGLPRNFVHLSAPEQLLVIVDIERVSRGEPPVVGISARADQFAQRAAVANEDPSLPAEGSGIPGATGGYDSNWAGAISPLDANYEWMYVDGWGGKATFNYDCTSPHAAGCWGHRDNVLTDPARMPCYSTCSLVMGAGFVRNGYSKQFGSYTELFVQVAGGLPPLSYTWSQALAAGARP